MNVTGCPISTSLSLLGYSKLTVNAVIVVGEAARKAAVGEAGVGVEASPLGPSQAANTIKHIHNHPILNMLIF